jgi:hypothetical protein
VYRHPILTAREQALLIEPSCACKGIWSSRRCVYHVSVGDEVIGKGISPTVAWEKALAKLVSERAVDHINGDPTDNRPENLRIVTIKESFGTKNRQRAL